MMRNLCQPQELWDKDRSFYPGIHLDRIIIIIRSAPYLTDREKSKTFKIDSIFKQIFSTRENLQRQFYYFLTNLLHS
jgi:hypothetical protein